jgi:hypothetical protein
MKKPPSIKSARITAHAHVEITWTTNETYLLDLSGVLQPKGKDDPYSALSNPEEFAKMTADDWGDGLDWPDGLSLGADMLYDLCREQAGLITVSAFNDWMQRNKLSLASAAESLGMTRRMIAYYRTGSRPIPKVVGLACKGWEAEHTRSNIRPPARANQA